MVLKFSDKVLENSDNEYKIGNNSVTNKLIENLIKVRKDCVDSFHTK